MIPAFLLKNPLASGMGALALVLGLGLGVQTLRLAWSQTEVAGLHEQKAKDIAEAERKVREASEADAKKNTALVAEYARQKADLQVKYEDAQIALARAQKSTVCLGTPAYRAFISGLPLDDGSREARPPESDPARRTGPRVPAPTR